MKFLILFYRYVKELVFYEIVGFDEMRILVYFDFLKFYFM